MKQTSKAELDKRKLFTEHATLVFNLVLFACLSEVLSGYLWKGTLPNPQEIQQITATGWMEMNTHASGLIWADFRKSFKIAQENWPGVTEDEMAATDPWAMGAAANIHLLQKAVSGGYYIRESC